MKKQNKIIVAVVILVVILAGWIWSGGAGLMSSSGSDYQAVFLTNDQVYFGKVGKSLGDQVLLTDIYYLQVSQPLQPSSPEPNVNLVKLGNELHGPADIMRINRDHILFIEDLKPDSKVVEAIKNYKIQSAVK